MKELPSIKEIIKDNVARFDFYRAGKMYYKLEVSGEDFVFPVDTNKDGFRGTFNASEKAISLMRWIRRAINEGTFTKA